eukprot:240639_1
MANLADLGMLPHGMRRRKSQSTAQIYIDELMEEYTCPICFDEIERCMMTPCGHNFCKKCIDECLNRKHICPFCSTECTQDRLIRNVHLDAVLSKLVKARAAASEELVSSLMQKSIENCAQRMDSPIAQIFMKYTSQTLIKYENYHQETLREAHRTELKLQNKLQHQLLSTLEQNVFEDIRHKIQQILNDDKATNVTTSVVSYIKSKQNEWKLSDSDLNEVETHVSVFDANMELSQNRVQKSCQLLFESYEEYMKQTGPSPFLLPVCVTIRLRGRPQSWDAKLNTTDHVGIVIEIVKRKFMDLGDDIDGFECEGKEEKVELGLLRPLGDRDEAQPLEIISNMETCLSELNIRQGTQIHVLSQFRLKSEAPRPCFTYNYDKTKKETCDYYRCKTCGFNWVCKPCSQQCHKEHVLVPFMMA